MTFLGRQSYLTTFQTPENTFQKLLWLPPHPLRIYSWQKKDITKFILKLTSVLNYWVLLSERVHEPLSVPPEACLGDHVIAAATSEIQRSPFHRIYLLGEASTVSQAEGTTHDWRNEAGFWATSDRSPCERWRVESRAVVDIQWSFQLLCHLC